MHIYEPISEIFLDFGIFVWYKYSFMIMTGMAIAIVLGLLEGKRLGILRDDIIDGVLIIVPLSIAGTRLWYVIFEWSRYLAIFKSDGFVDGVISVVNLTDGGLAIHGGFITAIISAYVYTKMKNISILRAVDLIAPGFLIAQAFGRWGNFFNQEAHGGMIGGEVNGSPALSLDEQRAFLSETLHLPDLITNNMLIRAEVGDSGHSVLGESGIFNYYHPTFLYESLWNVTGFIIMLILRRTKLTRSSDMLSFYLIWYSVGRFFIEGMRTDSLYVGNTKIRTAQLISIIMIALGIALIVVARKVFPQKKYYVVLEQYDILNALEKEMNDYQPVVSEEVYETLNTQFNELKQAIEAQPEEDWIANKNPKIEAFKALLTNTEELVNE